MNLRLHVFALTALSACSVGAPPEFSAGTSWAFPLVDPLANDLIVTPVMINGKGPYLFVVDPNVQGMAVDATVVHDAGLETDRGDRLRDRDDTDQRVGRFEVEVRGVQVGNLTIARTNGFLVPDGTYNRGGRRIDGALGTAIIKDSLTYGIDRDRGIGLLETREAFTPPPAASKLTYTAMHGKHAVEGTIGDARALFYVDLGRVENNIYGSVGDGFSIVEKATRTVDYIGSPHTFSKVAIARLVSVPSVTGHDVPFVPVDRKSRRIGSAEAEVSLGLAFFKHFNIWGDWDKETVYLTPRHGLTQDTKVRIERWGPRFAQCAHLGCATVVVGDSSATAEAPSADAPSADAPSADAPSAEPPSSVVLVTIRRDAETAASGLEVTIAVEGANGQELLLLVANFPAGVDQLVQHLPRQLAGVAMTVVDVSPFPHRCPSGPACVEVGTL